MNFKRFSTSDNQWYDVPYYQHKTATDTLTLPAVIYPNDTSITVGIKGNTTQSGTPSPQSPVDVLGTGERTGNLFNINAHDVNNGYVNDAQLNQDGTTETWESAEISEYIPISGDTAYTFNGIGSYNSPCYGLYDENKQLIGAYRYNGARIINFTSPNNARYFRFTHIKIATQAMTVEGTYTSSTMPEFEPYGYKIPISNGQQTTNIYLGSTQTVRQIKKLVLTGEESWNEETSNYYIFIDVQGRGEGIPNSDALCTHAENGIVVNNNGTALFFKKSVFVQSSLADFKTYLQQQYANGTPVCVWYVLATPQTTTVNEPLMKIGNYADSLTTSIPCTAGENTLDVQTTVAPSEVELTYTGWHDATVKEWDGSDWQ